MAKYIKKPVEIEAIQYTNINREEINEFVGQELKINLESESAYNAGKGAPIYSLIIQTLEGEHKAMPGDYIIKGVKGEFYPCKPDIFEITYASAEKKSGVQLIAEEREEQITKHYRSLTHDIEWNDVNQLAHGASILCTPIPPHTDLPVGWNVQMFDRMLNKPYSERLVIAGALIAAEIDRVNAIK